MVNLEAGLVGYDIPKKHSNQNKGDRNRDHGYEMLFLHSLSQLRLMNIRRDVGRGGRQHDATVKGACR